MRQLKVNAGVYVITNLVNGKQYVGSSKFLDSRKRGHFSDLKCHRSKSKAMQADYDLFGRSAFRFVVVEKQDPYDLPSLLQIEQHYLDTLSAEYNTNRIAGNQVGEYTKTPEAKAKFREKMLGRKQSPEHVAKRAASMVASGNRKGIPVSQEQRAKISAALSGENSIWFGKKIPAETLERRVESRAIEYRFIDPDGCEMVIINLNRYCKENGLPVNRFFEMVNGKRDSWHGWSFISKLKLHPK